MFGDAYDRGMRHRMSIPQIKTEVPSGLQEDETHYYALVVIEKADDHFRLATVSWPKKPLTSWLNGAEKQAPTAITTSAASYILRKISAGDGCVDDTWTATSGPPDGREGHTAVWTGSEMIIWGGEIYPIAIYGTGARYNPSTHTWTRTNTTCAPTPRTLHATVLTGSEMVVWGGLG